jgi:tight adherence protein C
LALSTKAGSDLVGAIKKIVDKSSGGALAEEFLIVLKDIALGSTRAEALKKMSERLDMSEITSFVAVIVDAEANGAPIYNVLKDQANQMRLERLVRAEKAGARASQTMLIPMMMFILPAIFIVVLGPIILQFLVGGN